MPKVRAPSLETATARLRLSGRKRPYYVTVSRGIALGYRRCAGAGSWSVRHADWLRRIGHADDYEASDGKTVLSYWEAVGMARALARGEDGSGDAGRPGTVSEALDAHAADLISRDGDGYNASRVRKHLSATLVSKP